MDAVTSNQVVGFISCQGLCTHNEWPYLEFQLTATNFVFMAAKSSNLVDETSGANLQMDDHADVPTQSVKDLWEPEALYSPPSCLLSWSLAWRLPSHCPNMKYCLEICMTLMEELGAIPPPSHSWMAPLVKDMLCDARTGLTEAVVTDPGRAVLFYGRHSMGEGLTMDEARDGTFLLTGAVTWVGKSAYLTADPVTIQEGKRAIAQAVLDHWVKVRGPRCSHVNLPALNPSGSIPLGVPLQKKHLEIVVLTTHPHHISPLEAGNIIGIWGTKGLNHLSSLPQTVDSRGTGVCYWQCPWCCPDLTGQTDQDAPGKVDNIEKKPAWR